MDTRASREALFSDYIRPFFAELAKNEPKTFKWQLSNFPKNASVGVWDITRLASDWGRWGVGYGGRG